MSKKLKEGFCWQYRVFDMQTEGIIICFKGGWWLMSIYGYCRCSTDESRQDIDRQIKELQKLGVTRDNIFFEYVSGRKAEKVEWNRLLERIKEGDTIAATEVSRLSRSTKQLCEIIEMAQARRIKLIIGGLEIDCSKDDPMSRAVWPPNFGEYLLNVSTITWLPFI